jgi:hypothetical protein
LRKSPAHASRVGSSHRDKRLEARAVGAAGGYENLLDFDVFEWNGYKINHAVSKKPRENDKKKLLAL